MRTRSERRYHRNRSIKRKGEIIQNTWGRNFDDLEPSRIGQLSKGKVHCSCGMCQQKSSKYLKHSDKKKIEKLNDRLENFISSEDY